jgi:hypothetical protein
MGAALRHTYSVTPNGNHLERSSKMQSNAAIKAEAYAQGRIDAGEPAFMDTDGFSSTTTTGAFAFHYDKAVNEGHDVNLTTAWAVFMEAAGRTVIHTDTDTPEDEMATVEETQALRDALDNTCGMSRTYVGGPTVRCDLRLGHSPRAKHTAIVSGNRVEWTTQESDQALADRIHYVPASTYSTEVTTTRYPVSTDAQVAADLGLTPARQPVNQEA